MAPLYLSLVTFVLLGLAGVALYAAVTSRHRAFDQWFSDLRVKRRLAHGALSSEETEERSVTGATFRWAIERLPEPKLDTPEGKGVAKLLARAGYFSSSTPRTFQLLRLFLTVVCIIAAMVLSAAARVSGLGSAALIVAAAMLGAWSPYLIVARKARRRRGEIAVQLSDVLDLLVVCVEAGLGVRAAIKVVGAETERQGQTIGRELALVSGEISAGATLGQALHALAERTRVDDIKPLAATMIQSEQLGAQMGPALRAISDGLRMTRKLRAEEAAQKTTIKMLFPLVFFILPAMLSVIVGPAIIQLMRTLSGVQ